MFPCDTYRDVEIEAYKPRSYRDLMDFTAFMLNASTVLHKARTPDVAAIGYRSEFTVFDFIRDLVPEGTDNVDYIFNVAYWQYRNNVFAEDLEPLCPKHESSRYPALKALYMDRILPNVYKLLAYCWTLAPFPLSVNKMEEMGDMLLASIYSYPWPESYLTKAEPCSICLENLYIVRYTTTCSHAFHSDCLFQWLRNNNSCPTCRHPIIF